MFFTWAGSFLLSAAALLVALNGKATVWPAHLPALSISSAATSSLSHTLEAQRYHAHSQTGPRLTRVVRLEQQGLNVGHKISDPHLVRLGRSVLAGLLIGVAIFGWGHSGRSPPSLSRKLF